MSLFEPALPAVILAGEPNSGKSVLAYLLSQHLRHQNVPHYLLRAAADGEGDWFLEGKPPLVSVLRRKHAYSLAFLNHIEKSIRCRQLPLLVDIGGEPQGEQEFLLKSCTHYILLYKDVKSQEDWHKLFKGLKAKPIAELLSIKNGREEIFTTEPFLQGSISCLEREAAKRFCGQTFFALLAQVKSALHVDGERLIAKHLNSAPYPVLQEKDIAKKLGVPLIGYSPLWQPSYLAFLSEAIELGKPLSLYGRGKVWLAAALAVATMPAALAIFDARFGWVRIPEDVPVGLFNNLEVVKTFYPAYDAWYYQLIMPRGVLELPTKEEKDAEILQAEFFAAEFGICQNNEEKKCGLILSGRLPRWAYAALARHYAPKVAWIAVDDPGANCLVVVHSRLPALMLGNFLARPSLPIQYAP